MRRFARGRLSPPRQLKRPFPPCLFQPQARRGLTRPAAS